LNRTVRKVRIKHFEAHSKAVGGPLDPSTHKMDEMTAARNLTKDELREATWDRTGWRRLVVDITRSIWLDETLYTTWISWPKI